MQNAIHRALIMPAPDARVRSRTSADGTTQATTAATSSIARITTGTLLWAWELYPRVLRTLSLHIPESGGKLPDYLAEVRWNLEWMLSLQDDDGGVWHKQTSEQFCGFIMPQQDTLTSYVIGTGAAPYKSTCATAGFAAVMAIAARCYGAYDATFSARCLAAAKRGFAWAVAHPNVPFVNPPGIGTGAYGERSLLTMKFSGHRRSFGGPRVTVNTSRLS